MCNLVMSRKDKHTLGRGFCLTVVVDFSNIFLIPKKFSTRGGEEEGGLGLYTAACPRHVSGCHAIPNNFLPPTKLYLFGFAHTTDARREMLVACEIESATSCPTFVAQPPLALWKLGSDASSSQCFSLALARQGRREGGRPPPSSFPPASVGTAVCVRLRPTPHIHTPTYSPPLGQHV